MEQENTRSKVLRELKEWVVALVIAFVAALLLTQVIFVHAKVPSESMESTIMPGDRILGFRLSYLFGEPKRGDIIIFRYPDDETQLYIKRIIGMPGEHVEVLDGLVFINHSEHPLDEPYIKEAPNGDFGRFEVPEEGYFVMGDNRDHSWDARYWQNTYVMRNKIIGKGIFRLFPKPGLLK